MSEYQPLSSAAELEVLNDDECVAGYMAGLEGARNLAATKASPTGMAGATE